MSIVDGRSCQVTSEGIVHASSNLPLDKVLYVLDFPVNLLSISAITKVLFCYVTFFPYRCNFPDLKTGKRIGLGRECGHGLYILVRDEIPKGLVPSISL